MSGEDLVDRLKAVPLFGGLTDKQLKRVIEAGRTVEFDAGQEVVREGESGVGLHVILTGSAEVSAGGAGKRPLGAGDYFGEISLLDGKPRSATVTIAEPTTTFSITAWAFAPLLEAHPEMLKTFVVELCRRLRESEVAPDAE